MPQTSERCRLSRGAAAFTLTEVLITLAIVGIVAIMTISNLVAKYQEKVNIVRLKKVYSTLNAATNLAIEENDRVNTWMDSIYSDPQKGRIFAVRKNLSKHLKYTKSCSPPSACLPKLGQKKTNGTPHNQVQHILGQYESKQEKFYLLDGTVIVIKPTYTDSATWCNSPVTETSGIHYANNCAVIYVDINGENTPPNQDGKDIFAFRLYQNILLPLGVKIDHSIENFEVCAGKSNYCFNWGTCTAWVLRNENMDYLHCPEKLDWDGAKSCKEAKSN